MLNSKNRVVNPGSYLGHVDGWGGRGGQKGGQVGALILYILHLVLYDPNENMCTAKLPNSRALKL